jgi:hypothetical protein
VFTISFVMLGWLGLQPATGVYTMLARVFTVLYFAFFLLMPIYSKIDKTKPPGQDHLPWLGLIEAAARERCVDAPRSSTAAVKIKLESSPTTM